MEIKSEMLKETLPAEIYMEHFPHNERPHRTVALFTIRREDSPDLIAKGFSLSQIGCHAERWALQQIQNHIPVNDENYVVTLFISNSPCLFCCNDILAFLQQRNRVQMKIQASKIFPDKRGLRLLNEAGVSIKMMRRADYEESFQLFVHPPHSFEPWEDLDACSLQQAEKLNRILQK